MTDPLVNRRSFLAAIVGAVAAEAFPQRTQQQELLTKSDELWEEAKRVCADGPVYQPFWFWEKVALDAPRVEICPPPLPPEMLLLGISLHFEPQVPYAVLKDVYSSWELRMRHNSKDLLAGRFAWLGLALCDFPVPVRVLGSDSFMVEAAGEPADCCALVAFKGLVLL